MIFDKSINKLCKEHGISRRTYYLRIGRGMTPEEALTTKKKNGSKWAPKEVREYRRQRCKELGISMQTYYARRWNGWTEEEALAAPKFNFAVYYFKDGRRLWDVVKTPWEYTEVRRFVADLGMSVDDAWNYFNSKRRNCKYKVNGQNLTDFCKEHKIDYKTAWRLIQDNQRYKPTGERRSRYVQSCMQALGRAQVHFEMRGN